MGKGGLWCILRTSSAKTLPLARSLRGAGFDAWTPIEKRAKRMQRGKRAETEVEVPMLPTFVLVRSERLADLIVVSEAHDSPHPSFSVFTHHGRIPAITDADTQGLHHAEEQAALRARRKQRKAYVLGQRVKIEEGSFAGMSGIVQSSNDRHAYVQFEMFGGKLRVKVATWLLKPADVFGSSAQSGIAA